MLAALAGGAIGITSPLLTAETAEAMGAKIDPHLSLVLGGVEVTGTFNSWDMDEHSAVVTTQITQDGHVADGQSRRYQHGATRWDACAMGHLRRGKATGHAQAHIIHTNGTHETYKWTVPVTLIS
jgi:hypothetical protein